MPPCGTIYMLGARAAAIVRVRIAALVVGIDVAKPRVAAVVVVAAATGKALTNAWIQTVQITARSLSVPISGLRASNYL